MRVLVTFAVDAEFAPWRVLRPFHPRFLWGVPVHSTRQAGLEITVRVTGIGLASAAGPIEKVLQAEPFDLCVSTGLAGALQSGHLPGEILVAREVCCDDAPGGIAGDPRLVELAATSGARIVDRFFSSRRILVKAAEKAGPGRIAQAVEMESFAILGQAGRFGVPGVAVRAISDGFDEDLPLDLNRVVTGLGSVSMTRVLAELARHPLAVPRVVRFGRQSRRAAESLAKFLDGFTERLTADGGRLELEMTVSAT